MYRLQTVVVLCLFVWICFRILIEIIRNIKHYFEQRKNKKIFERYSYNSYATHQYNVNSSIDRNSPLFFQINGNEITNLNNEANLPESVKEEALFTEIKNYTYKAIIAKDLYIDSLKSVFFAIDVETTGLNSFTDKIIEISAVKFVNGYKAESYSSLVSSVKHIPSDASKINGITDKDLENFGKSEIIVYNEFADFLGEECLNGKICVVAHYARFDMGFIINTLQRLKFNRNVLLRYFDTWAESTMYVDNVENYKLPTVAKHFNIVYVPHRALNDAQACGEVLIHLLKKMEFRSTRARVWYEKSIPLDEEKEICAFIKQILNEKKCDTNKLFFRRWKTKVDVKCTYGFMYFTICKNKSVNFVFNKEYYIDCGVKSSEIIRNKRHYIQVNIINMQEIGLLSESIYNGYQSDFYEYHSDFDELHFQIEDNQIEPLIYRYIKRKMEKKKENNHQEELTEKKKVEKQDQPKKTQEKNKKAKESQKLSFHNNVGKRIKCFDNEMHFINEYNSIAAASKAVGINSKSIREAANGKQKHAAGYIWKFSDN